MKEIVKETPYTQQARVETPDSVAPPKTSGGTVIESYEIKHGQRQETYESTRTGALYEDSSIGGGGMESEIF